VTPLAGELAADVLERFLRYARIDTQSAYGVDASPSTEKQLDLCRLLRDELEEIGLERVRLDEHGYVYGSLPGKESAPRIGLIAHVDTSPDVTATGVTPIVHEGYDGGTLELPKEGVVLDPAETRRSRAAPTISTSTRSAPATRTRSTAPRSARSRRRRSTRRRWSSPSAAGRRIPAPRRASS
jgi:hypothetical protein